jgi:hypothetical protein
MQTVDPINHIRSNRAMYIPGAGDPSSYLAQRLLSDAMLLGASHVNVHRDGDWYTVAADKDWLANSGAQDVRELFSRVVPFPQAGVNSMRAEVLLSAFARDVITSDESTATPIQGNVQTSLFPLLAPWPWARIVRFRV